MNRLNNHNSAFYSGPTRYGGAAAVAKRREAARKAFFAVKEVPTTSARSNTLNGPNLINTYTINNDNIVRREPVVPQMTSHAKKILSWIEENSGAQQETFQITKRNQRTKHRFNPMAYRAPIFKPLEQPIPALNSPPRLNNVNPEWNPPELIDKIPELRPAPVVEIPKSTSFTTTKIPVPVKNIDVQPEQKKEFAIPKDVSSSPQKQPEKYLPKTTVSSFAKKYSPQTQTQPKASPLQATAAFTKQPVVSPPPSTPKQLPVVEAPKSSRFTAVEFCGPTKDINVQSTQKKVFISPRDLKPSKKQPEQTPPKITFTPFSSITTPPILSEKPPAKNILGQVGENNCVPVIKQDQKVEKIFNLTPEKETTSKPFEPTNLIFSTTPQSKKVNLDWNPPTVIKKTPEKQPLNIVEAPKSTRFTEVKFSGPTKDIDVKSTQKKIFTPPRDLSPPQKEPEKIPPKVIFTPFSNQTAPQATTPQATTPQATTPQPEKAPTPAPTPNLTPTPTPVIAPLVQPTTVSTPTPITNSSNSVSTSPILDVEMDIEMDPPSALPGTLPTPASASATTASTLQTPATTVTTSTIQQSPVPPTSAPAMVFQPLFMPPPSFPTPTFTSPVPPPVTTISETIPNGSNPFQPSINTRGRKILRPARRLHR